MAAQPDLVKTLENSKTAITMLAPNNEAFTTFMNTASGKAASSQSDVVAAVLEYHVLNGDFPGSSFTSKAQFAPTLLTNTSYTNVTGGQVVQAQLSGSTVQITSGLKAVSKVITSVS